MVTATGSTNADLADAARGGETGPRVLAARRQDAGRGRLDRAWSSPAGASVAVSWLWAPRRPRADWPWLPVVVGLGVVDAVAALGVTARLKWPNDVVVDVAAQPAGVVPGDAATGATAGLRKLAGVLVEVAVTPDGTACAVAGVGLNVGLGADDLPVPTATSVRLLTGRDPGFDAALAALLDGVGARLSAWDADADAHADADADAAADVAGPDARLREAYRQACTTLGREVRVTTPGGAVRGTAVDVDTAGRLLVRGDDGRVVGLSAGDVEHVR